LRAFAGNARFFGIFEQVDNGSKIMFERAGDRILNYTNKLTDILTSGFKYGLLGLPFEVFDIMFDFDFNGKKYNIGDLLNDLEEKYKKLENFLIEMRLPVKKKGFFN
jgi:predicted PolB exonuclease-like 3'-5' exonuclease